MPLRCSCGAILPEDARFCHKCGQPQYAEDIERLKAVESPLPAIESTPAPLPQSTGFQLGTAIGITVMVSLFAMFALFIATTLLPPLLVPVMMSAGFASVRLYLSRTNSLLSVSGAAALGAMPGILLPMVDAAGICVAIFTPEGRAMLKGWNNPAVTKLLDQPEMLVSVLLASLLICGVSAGVGGILALRRQTRNRPSH